MRIGISREWDDIEHPRDKKYKTCGRRPEILLYKVHEGSVSIIIMSMSFGRKCFRFEFQLDCSLAR